MSTTCAALLLLLLLVAAPTTAAESRRASTTTESHHASTTAAESRRVSTTAESHRASTTAAESRRASTTAGTSFGHSSWKSKLTLLGAASFVTGHTSVALITNSTDAGRALFTEPVRLLLPRADPRAAPAPASFYSQFKFRIVPSPSYGDGLAFNLTSSPSFLGASNGFLGLYASDRKSGEPSDVYTVAVELDTHMDAALGDLDDNHVAVDAGSIFSAASTSPGVDFKSGKRITAWVEYRASRRRLRAWLSYSSRRPRDPALAVVIDLSRLLDGDVYVGFSASNGPGTALHIIDSWSFQTTQSTSQGSSSPAPVPSAAAAPKNSSSPVPVPTEDQNGHLKFVLALVSSVVIVPILVIYCIMCLRRRLKTKKSVEMCSILPKSVPRSCLLGL